MKGLIIFLLMQVSINCFAQKLKIGKTISCHDFAFYADSGRTRLECDIDWKNRCARVVTYDMKHLPDTSYISYQPDWDCPASRNINKERLKKGKTKRR